MSNNTVIAHTIDKTFRNNFVYELNERRRSTLENIGAGVDDYRYWVGYLKCLDDIIKTSDEIMSEILRD